MNEIAFFAFFLNIKFATIPKATFRQTAYFEVSVEENAHKCTVYQPDLLQVQQ